MVPFHLFHFKRNIRNQTRLKGLLFDFFACSRKFSTSHKGLPSIFFDMLQQNGCLKKPKPFYIFRTKRLFQISNFSSEINFSQNIFNIFFSTSNFLQYIRTILRFTKGKTRFSLVVSTLGQFFIEKVLSIFFETWRFLSLKCSADLRRSRLVYSFNLTSVFYCS